MTAKPKIIQAQEGGASPESYLAAIVESSDDAILSKTLKGIITSWNSAAERIFGYTAEEAIGKHISLLIPPERLPEEEEIIARLKKGERIDHYETVRMAKDGRYLQVSLTISPIRGPDGAIIGASKIARNITEQNRLNIIVTSQKLALEQAMQNMPVPRILEGLLRALEENVPRYLHAAIMLLDAQIGHLHLVAAPSLPPSFKKELADVRISANCCSCAAVARKRVAVLAADIATDPDWGGLREAAIADDLRACWSTPLLSTRGQLLGTVALYYRESRTPREEERGLLDYFARTASIIVERENEAVERQRIEQSLSEETQTLETLNRLSKLLASTLDVDAVVTQTTEALTLLTNAQYGAFYYDRLDEKGEYYSHYKLSSFSGQPQQNFLVPRRNALFADTFKGNIIRINDLQKDAKYGNLLREGNLIPSGFPPIRSFLTIPVHSRNGAVLGGLFFGHAEPDAFDDRAMRIAESAASYAAVSIDNAQLYQQMKESQQSWKTLAEAMPQLVWVSRADGFCEYLSSQWESYSGVPVRKLLGYEWLKFLHPDDQERTRLAWAEAVADRAPYDLDYRIRRRDGSYRWFRVRGVPIRDEAGQIRRWYGTCTDIQELVESRDAAEQASIAKSDFLANMSHEIRTPMNAVVGLANILAVSGPLNERQQEFVKTLQLSANALLDLINDLLDIAKIEARTVDLEEVPFSVVQVVQEVVDIMAVKAREKGLTFQFSSLCECIHKRIFMGDPTRLRQILMNLCSNALKFTERGGVEILIECRPADRPGLEEVEIRVKDSGIGIAPHHLPAIFDKFVQADSSINRKYGGTGLGLAITRTLTELMGGRVDVQSELGKGSEFMVVLPLALESGHGGPQLEMPMETKEGRLKEQQKRILLVEDYAPNVLVATTFLEEFGYECDVVSNGLDAVEKVKSGGYALVLMDVQMHGMNGMDATRAIREYEAENKLKPIPIIGMTAHVLHGDKERCLEAGMDDYISKPFDPPLLKDKIALYIHSRSLAG